MHDTPPLHSTTLSTSTPASGTTSGHTPARSVELDAARSPHDQRRRELRFWAYLAVSGLCAVLIPVAVFVAAPIDDGLPSALIAWLIAVLMGLAVYFSAVASDAAHRLR